MRRAFFILLAALLAGPAPATGPTPAQVLADGEPTGATPGRVVRGPGWNRCPPASR